jgi:hypothetical protein
MSSPAAFPALWNPFRFPLFTPAITGRFSNSTSMNATSLSNDLNSGAAQNASRPTHAGLSAAWPNPAHNHGRTQT